MVCCRLLDDNRELFVPELQEVVKPHPHFMLFATQNPAGAYAGRKVMSRAFRSRFLELHVGDIPADELSTILHQRCAIAPSHADKLVSVMRELQRRRQVHRVRIFGRCSQICHQLKTSFGFLNSNFRPRRLPSICGVPC